VGAGVAGIDCERPLVMRDRVIDPTPRGKREAQIAVDVSIARAKQTGALVMGNRVRNPPLGRQRTTAPPLECVKLRPGPTRRWSRTDTPSLSELVGTSIYSK
jgi:hypothetical protein